MPSVDRYEIAQDFAMTAEKSGMPLSAQYGARGNAAGAAFRAFSWLMTTLTPLT